MQLVINIDDTQRHRVLNALSKHYGYQDKVVDPNNLNVVQSFIDNPQTKAQFVKQQIIEHIKNIVKQVELDEARRNLTVEAVDVS
jgi:hypothetical protein